MSKVVWYFSKKTSSQQVHMSCSEILVHTCMYYKVELSSHWPEQASLDGIRLLSHGAEIQVVVSFCFPSLTAFYQFIDFEVFSPGTSFPLDGDWFIIFWPKLVVYLEGFSHTLF